MCPAAQHRGAVHLGSSEPVMTITRCLILGHDGFIGSHLCRRLAERWPQVAVEGLSQKQTDLADDAAADVIAPRLGPGSAVVVLAAIKRQVGDNAQAYLRNMALCA